MSALLAAVATTGPTFRLQLKLDQTDAEVEADMAKSRFDALGLAPGVADQLRWQEFGCSGQMRGSRRSRPDPADDLH
jgi:hypothetical protein